MQEGNLGGLWEEVEGKVLKKLGNTGEWVTYKEMKWGRGMLEAGEELQKSKRRLSGFSGRAWQRKNVRCLILLKGKAKVWDEIKGRKPGEEYGKKWYCREEPSILFSEALHPASEHLTFLILSKIIHSLNITPNF